MDGRMVKEDFFYLVSRGTVEFLKRWERRFYYDKNIHQAEINGFGRIYELLWHVEKKLEYFLYPKFFQNRI